MKQIPIILCEDNITQLNLLKLAIENYILINELPMKVELARINPFEVISYIKNNNINNGIYVLDIELGTTIDGIDLGLVIREMDPLGKIIFITTHDELAQITLDKKIEPFAYISKKSKDYKSEITECIDLIYERLVRSLDVQKRLLTFTIAKKVFHVDLNSVLFFESSTTPHKIILYTDNGQYEFYGKMNEYELTYPELFRCHKAYLINPKRIESVDFKKRQIYFEQEMSCLFSINKKKKLEMLFSIE